MMMMIYNVRVRRLVVGALVRWCPVLQRQRPLDDDDEDADDEEGEVVAEGAGEKLHGCHGGRTLS